MTNKGESPEGALGVSVGRRIVIVTGGAGGLGKAIVRRLCYDGFIVYCCDVDDVRGSTFVNEFGEAEKSGSTCNGAVRFIHLDVALEKDWIAAVAKIVLDEGRIDVLVNNAGINIRVDIEDCTVEQWDRMFAVNVRGVFLGIKHVLPVMKARRDGVVVNISSICGLVGHVYTNESYTATKGALTLLTRSVASRYARFGIRCNSIHPSTIETEIVNSFLANPARMRERLEEVPLKRLGVPGDVAAAVGFLASQDACFLNGVQLPVDGGLVAY